MLGRLGEFADGTGALGVNCITRRASRACRCAVGLLGRDVVGLVDDEDVEGEPRAPSRLASAYTSRS